MLVREALPVLTAVSIGLLALWLVLSLLAQFQIKALRPLLRHDVFSLLPVWTFFAPRPAAFDFNRGYRFRLASGELSPWREVLPCRERRLREALWNPERRCKKILDATLRALTQLRPGGNKNLSETKPYAILLRYVSALPREPGAAAIEFRILRSEGFLAAPGSRLVFQSDCHPLAD